MVAYNPEEDTRGIQLLLLLPVVHDVERNRADDVNACTVIIDDDDVSY